MEEGGGRGRKGEREGVGGWKYRGLEKPTGRDVYI